MGRNTAAGRAHALALAGLCLAAVACQQPAVGTRAEAAAPTEGPRIVIESALPDLHGHVVATFSVSQDDVPLLRADVEALDPRFTLATLSAHPVDGLRAWKSQLLNGPQVAVALPPSGPGTPAALVLANVRQPGAETPTSLVDLGDGRFRYVFATALTAFDPDETIRVGAWLAAAPKPSARTSATYDFRPSGGPVEQRDTVVDESCASCHGAAVVHHRTRSGVGLCLTCHTWQNSDPNTFDPAALGTPTIFTDSNSKNNTAPNPLELGRLVHRLHRGKRLPTLYLSRSTAWDPDPLSTTGTLPVPTQSTSSSGFIEGRSFTVVGDGGIMSQYGRFVRRARLDGTTVLAAEGVQFPTDLRDCGVCHEGAPQEYEVTYAISRRTCSGCHPDAWFGPAPISDVSHAQHPGGPQADDSGCASCHIPGVGPKTWAPISGPDAAHVAPWKGARYNRPRIEIVSIADFQPGLRPTIRFKVADRVGTLAPTLGSPVPAFEPSTPGPASRARRGFGSSGIEFEANGPNSASGALGQDFLRGAITGRPAGDVEGSGAEGDEYLVTLGTIPAGATGAWVVTAEASRTQNTATWSAVMTYGEGELATRSTTYRAIVPAGQTENLGHQPPSATWWAPLPTPAAWSATTSYAAGDVVTTGSGSSRKTYVSLQAANTGNAVTDTAWWATITNSAAWSATTSYAADRLVTQTTTFQSLHDANVGHDPLDVSYWMAIATPASHYFKDENGRPASFIWPYTGEAISEVAPNPIVWVDTGTGTWPDPRTGADAPNRRRKIVSTANCNKCHGRLVMHTDRGEPEFCIVCHAPNYADSTTTLSTTYDGVGQKSLQLKMIVHRIHTGGRRGSASLEAIQPVLTGTFFEGLFPNDLRNCTVCHAGKSYLVESVPGDAAPTVANETADPSLNGLVRTPPVQAACVACHATGATFAHVATKTAKGVETCPQCHGAKGAKSTEVVHGLLPATGTAASASFSSILQNVLVPRCASTACHAAGGAAPILEASSAYAALVGAPSGQSSLLQVEPFAVDRSYLVYKLRGDAGSVGGSVTTIMPTDGALAPADLAAIEAWIANGAPND